MRDEDKNYRTMKQIIKDSTDRELERYETKGLTPDELKTMVAAAKRKKKQRYRKLAGVAALFVVVLFGAIIVFNNFSTDVEADKNAKEEIITEDGVVIEDGGWGGNSENNWVITDWSEVKVAKTTVHELIIPQYVPEGYIFRDLIIERVSEEQRICVYMYMGEEGTIQINQIIDNSSQLFYEINEYQRILSTSKGDVYIQNEDEKKAIIQIDDGNIIEIYSGLPNDEILKIIELADF